MQQSVTVIGVKLSSQTGVITALHVTCKNTIFINYKLLDFLFIKIRLFFYSFCQQPYETMFTSFCFL